MREAPVPVFVNLMLTPGRTAPAESLTVPVIVPVVTCAIAMPPTSNRQKKSLNPSCLRIMRFLPNITDPKTGPLPAPCSWEDQNKTKRICRGCYNNTEPPRQSLFVTVGAVREAQARQRAASIYGRPQCRNRDHRGRSAKRKRAASRNRPPL